MLLDGVSIKGDYHEINQDSFKVKKLDKGFVAALSDGLGSKKKSQYGSKAICESIVEVIEEKRDELISIDADKLVTDIYMRWKEKLVEYTLADCYATMLFLFAYSGRGMAVRLGDGFVGFWYDNSLKVLFDRKEDYYANETDCLTESLLLNKLEICEFEISDLYGGIICSDGIGVGNMTEPELESFTKEFVDGYCEMNNDDVKNHISSWLCDWTGNDDKTLAYFISERS